MTTVTEQIFREYVDVIDATTPDDVPAALQKLRRLYVHLPTNPNNRRTAVIAGKAYHWCEFNGRLCLLAGPAPSEAVTR